MAWPKKAGPELLGRGLLLTSSLNLVWPPQTNWKVAGWAKGEKRSFLQCSVKVPPYGGPPLSPGDQGS